MTYYYSEEKLEEHERDCYDVVKIRMPTKTKVFIPLFELSSLFQEKRQRQECGDGLEEGNWLELTVEFKNYGRSMQLPFVIYVDL